MSNIKNVDGILTRPVMNCEITRSDDGKYFIFIKYPFEMVTPLKADDPIIKAYEFWKQAGPPRVFDSNGKPVQR